jgi:hypothetical protein
MKVCNLFLFFFFFLVLGFELSLVLAMQALYYFSHTPSLGYVLDRGFPPVLA